MGPGESLLGVPRNWDLGLLMRRWPLNIWWRCGGGGSHWVGLLALDRPGAGEAVRPLRLRPWGVARGLSPGLRHQELEQRRHQQRSLGRACREEGGTREEASGSAQGGLRKGPPCPMPLRPHKTQVLRAEVSVVTWRSTARPGSWGRPDGSGVTRMGGGALGLGCDGEQAAQDPEALDGYVCACLLTYLFIYLDLFLYCCWGLNPGPCTILVFVCFLR